MSAADPLLVLPDGGYDLLDRVALALHPTSSFSVQSLSEIASDVAQFLGSPSTGNRLTAPRRPALPMLILPL